METNSLDKYHFLDNGYVPEGWERQTHKQTRLIRTYLQRWGPTPSHDLIEHFGKIDTSTTKHTITWWYAMKSCDRNAFDGDQIMKTRIPDGNGKSITVYFLWSQREDFPDQFDIDLMTSNLKSSTND